MPRVLLLISDSEVTNVASIALRGAHFDVEAAATGEAALQAVEARCPDAVFVHTAAVPQGAGVFATQLRQTICGESLPICLVGPRPDVEYEARAYGCEFLPNPLSLLRLRATARKMVAASRLSADPPSSRHVR